MKVLLVHNPTAGCGDHEDETLLAVIRQAGHQVHYCSTKEDGWDSSLADTYDLICAAGGDGTVDKVATRMAGRGIPITVLPLGTANNIARTLGFADDPEACVAAWSKGRLTPFDLGVVEGPYDELLFVETAGVGLFPQLMPILEALHEDITFDDEEAKMSHELKSLRGLLKNCEAQPWTLNLDGVDASGEFLMVQAMNVSRLGPGLRLAPDADPGDGWFDVVTVTGDEQELLEDYLEKCRSDRDTRPRFTIRRARHVQIEWEGSDVHADSELWAQGNRIFAGVKAPQHSAPLTMHFRIRPHALDFLVPPTARGTASKP